MTGPSLLIAMSHDEIRVFLADREGLTGSARSRFWEILDRYDAFRRVGFQCTWTILLILSLFISGLCYFLDPTRSHWIDLLVWPGAFLLSIGPIWHIRRQERRPFRIDAETEWRAYCLFLRPIILAEQPGLLDRNLASPATVTGQILPRPFYLLKEQIKTQGLDYWWSALGGIWGAMILLLILHYLLVEPGRWLAFSFPIAGLLVGPLLGSLVQSGVYFLARRGVGDS
jgi:hypothetical protein